MLRKSSFEFMDLEQSAQCMLDDDIFPKWEEEQKKKEDLHIS